MPDVDLPTWLAWLLVTGAAAGALAAVANLGVRAHDGLTWWQRRRHRALAHQLSPILAELRPNGGASLRDELRHIGLDVGEVRELLDAHVTESSLDRADLRRWVESHDLTLDQLLDQESKP